MAAHETDETPKLHTFLSATDNLKERLSKYGLSSLPVILAKTTSVIAGSYPLQCILNEVWSGSDINIFCKHLLAYEDIEEYLLSLESIEKVEAIERDEYPGYRKFSNFRVNYAGNRINIELIVVDNYLVIQHLERDIDIDICRVYFDGCTILSYTDPDNFNNRRATLDRNTRLYIYDGALNQIVRDDYIQRRCSKYEDRGFKIGFEYRTFQNDIYQPPLYLDKQIEAPIEVHNLILERLSAYNLNGIGEVLSVLNDVVMTGDFLLNCVLDDHWENTRITIYLFGYAMIGANFFSERGYHHENLPGPDVDIFYVPDPNYKEGPNRNYPDRNFPEIHMLHYHGPDITTICQHDGLDIEKIFYDGKNIYSYALWEKIQRRIGFVRGKPRQLEKYEEKYKDRNVFITDDKYNMGAVVKSARKL